ncbi:MAG: RNA pyrophosphohydrolase [Legionellales bacterium]|nr:RNA pyrophosphohydrolase [Legionellales bacterium]
MIDEEGYRANIGIILANSRGEVFWGKRIGQDAWQFPQGGMQKGESPQDALYRELDEEIGLAPEHVSVLGQTQDWLRYDLPKPLIRYYSKPVCIGQKQKWFCLRFVGDEADIKLDSAAQPEFDDWRWVDYWHPLDQVIAFKQDVYRQALKAFADIVTPTPES